MDHEVPLRDAAWPLIDRNGRAASGSLDVLNYANKKSKHDCLFFSHRNKRAHLRDLRVPSLKNRSCCGKSTTAP
jgi:hypothetical protein